MEENKKVELYLNMIVKHDEPVEIVKRSIDSVKDHVDGIYVTVTYDDTMPGQNELMGVLNSYKNMHVSMYKWTNDFSEARQFALDQVPKGDHIYFYWQDADDVLKGAEHLHRIAEEAHQQFQAAIYFNYWYMVELDEQGDVREILIEHKRERIVRNDDTFRWIGPLHETLIEQKRENLIRISRPECTVVHLSSDERTNKGIDRNIKILEEAAKEEQHKDPRTLIYLAKAYFDKAKFIK